MNRIIFFCLSLLVFQLGYAQHANIGIGTASPDSSAKLDIHSINKGLLIPRIALLSVDSTAPISNPSVSLLVFNTTTNAELEQGYYYWNGTQWLKLSTANTNLGLDDAYDAGTPGGGRTIVADQGAVSIEGQDGFQILGTLNNGQDIEVLGAGTRLFFNPRKSAFRAGTITGNQWDPDSIGLHSVAMGYNTLANGAFSTALGLGSKARGFTSISLGNMNQANNTGSVAIGNANSSNGLNSIAIGYNNNSSGGSSLALGYNNKTPYALSYAFGSDLESFSAYEMVLGRFNTSYTPNSIFSWHPQDRLLTIGNGLGSSNKSDALIIYKSGDAHIIGKLKIGLTSSNYTLPNTNGTSNQILVNNGSGELIWQDQNDKSNTLDEAYDQGGAGQGRNIIADSGAVSIAGTDGFQVLGSHGTGQDVQIVGAGTRMFFNPKKSAFRAGYVNANQWDQDSIGNYSVAMGINNLAKGNYATSLGSYNKSRAAYSSTLGYGNLASGEFSVAIGNSNTSSAYSSHSFGNYNQATGSYSSSIGHNNNAAGLYSMSMGYYSSAYGDFATTLGSFNVSSGWYSTTMGVENVAGAYASTATGYGTSAFGNHSFSMGQYTTAVGANSIAGGNSSSATGTNSFAGGNFGNAGGENAIAYGDSCFADGEAAVALGKNVSATGNYATSIGYNNEAPSLGATSIGYNNIASNAFATSLGLENISSGNSASSLGRYNESSGDFSFTAGVANVAGGGASIALGNSNEASAPYSLCLGRDNIASANYSMGIGKENSATGEYSLSLGVDNQATGSYSASIGSNNSSSGIYSMALGHFNSVNYGSMCVGSRSIAIGEDSYTFGIGLSAVSRNEVVVGSYNTPDPNPNFLWDDTDNIFVVGNGTSAFNTSNALVIRKNGTVGIQYDSPFYALMLPNNSNVEIGRARANSWTTYSDRRIKSNIQEISYGLQTILKLKPVSYFQHNSSVKENELDISDEGSQQIGFIAQELYEEVPEAVDKPKNEDTELWGVDYTKIIPVLVKAIQEQQEEIEYLKALLENQ